MGSTSTWLASSGELATPVPLPTLAHWDLHLPGLHPQVSWLPQSLSLLFSTMGSTSTWLSPSGELAIPVPLPTLQHIGIYIYLARILR